MIFLATRVLNTIQNNGKIVGFRIVSSSKKIPGIHSYSLKKCIEVYQNIEHFENFRYNGNGNWENLECRILELPSQGLDGNYIECNAKWFLLGRMLKDGVLVGYKLMDLNGDVFYKGIKETETLYNSEGFINAKCISDDSSFDLDFKKSGVPTFEDKKGLVVSSPQVEKSVKDIGNLGNSVIDYDSRMLELSNLFALKQKGEKTDRDIANVVGAKSGSEYSVKIHEYLGISLDVPDKDVLRMLYNVYKQNNGDKIDKIGKNSQIDNKEKDSDMNKSVNKNNNLDVVRMQELIDKLVPAAEAYYTGADEIMSNYEYDKLYNELEDLEKKTGIVLAGSLTQRVGFEVKSKLPKVKHATKMLSLDKTKDRQELANSLGGQEGFLGWKLDGLTCVITYENGELVSAVTRGNGSIGEDITHNAKFFAGVPHKISYKDRLVVRGEALISRKNFDRINAQITNVDDKYKNARNLASGSVRQLDSKIAKERHVEVVSFTVVEGFDWIKTYTGKLEELRKYGFDIVPYIKVKPSEVIKGIEYFEDKVEKYKFPTDGLVITIDDIAYGEMLGTTAKFPRNSKAFKWQDEPEATELIGIDWSVGRTGAITPVAVFKPVDIDGTTVQRASVHNVSILKQLKLGIGDTVNIIKSNMIIPQVVENITKSGTCVPPSVCPICGGPTQIQISQQAEVLMCINANCLAKHIGNLTHFVERDAMNIDGLSEATLERFVNEKFIRSYRDIYHLSDYEKEIVNLDGFGRASYNKLIKAIEKSRECELPSFIYALGINQVGKRTAKDICQGLDYDLNCLLNITEDDLKKLPNIGDKTAYEFVSYMQMNKGMVLDLAKELSFKAMPKINRNTPISGLIFCITGDVYQFKNRKELQAKIESLGGKASSSVSAKTNYLINNDITSNSNKNQTAKKLGIPIISEQDFLQMIQGY